MTPIIGDLIESTVGNVVNRLTDRFLPKSMSEAEKAEYQLKMKEAVAEETKLATADMQSARQLASDEAKGAPGWTKILTVTHRPAWSFVVLGLFVWIVIAPYIGVGVTALKDGTMSALQLPPFVKEIMKTVIMFYFGGRTVEKALTVIKDMKFK